MYKEIQNYEDFLEAMNYAGFSMGGGNSDGIYAVIPWGWKDSAPYDTPVKWHTDDIETDPWEWRMRVLDEKTDIAYSKLFFKKSGYITKKWYPYFLAVRRSKRSFEEEYADGKISNYAKRIYEVIKDNGTLPLHAIKALAGFSKEDKSKFDSAITELQMKMYITMCGRQQKLSKKGEEYGWSSTVFCKVEDFWDSSVFKDAEKLDFDEAYAEIAQQIIRLNPDATERKIKKFILG